MLVQHMQIIKWAMFQKGRYYVQQAINVIGFFGHWGASISIGLSIIDSAYGDEIEKWMRE